jgi:integrase
MPIPTLREAVHKYIELRDGKVKTRTLSNYRSLARCYLREWLDLPLTQITGAMVVQRHREITKKGATQANRVMMTLSAVINLSIFYYGLDLKNPVKHLSVLKCWNKEASRKEFYLELHELKAWMQAVRRSRNPDSRDLLVFLLMTGVRLSEATEMLWSDVDLDHGLVWIGSRRRGSTFETKNKQCHRFPLCTFLIDMLRHRQFTQVKTDRVFPVSWPYRTIKQIGLETGVTFRAHDLRRSFANLLSHPAVDADELELKALLNHVTDVTRRHYLTVHTERLRPVMERLSQLILRESGLPSVLCNPGVLLIEDIIDVEVVESALTR